MDTCFSGAEISETFFASKMNDMSGFGNFGSGTFIMSESEFSAALPNVENVRHVRTQKFRTRYRCGIWPTCEDLEISETLP